MHSAGHTDVHGSKRDIRQQDSKMPPKVADSGLHILAQFVERLLSGPPQLYVGFFKQYYFTLLQAQQARTSTYV